MDWKFKGGALLTAVIVSMHSTKGSEVRYRESERAYSFHNWPKRSWAGPIRLWFREKYPKIVNWAQLRAIEMHTFEEQMNSSSCQSCQRWGTWTQDWLWLRHLQITNHQMAAFSVPGRLGWTFLTMNVVVRIIETQIAVKRLSSTVTEYSLAR